MKPSRFTLTTGRLVAGGLLALAAPLPAAPALPPAPGVTFTEAGRWPGWPRGGAESVAMFGHHACLLTSGGLLVFDVSDAAAPRLVGSCETPGGGNLVLQGHLAYFISGGELQIVDLSDPTRPKPMGRRLSEYPPSAVAVSGERAYVADWEEGLLIVDVSDPANPVRRGALPMGSGDWVIQVVAAGHHAYLVGAGPQPGVQIADASDPAQPVHRGRFPTPGRVREMAAAGNLLLVATSDDISFADHRLRILDISDPARPRQVATHPIAEAVSDLFVAGSLAYVTDIAGLLILDLSNPANPRQVRRIAPQTAGRQGGPGLALKFVPTAAWRGVAAAGQRLCVAAGGEGLLVFDAGDPTEPVPAGRFETAGRASAVAVAGHHACLADGAGGVRVLDLTDPARPALTGQLKLERRATHIVVSGPRACLYDTDQFWISQAASRIQVLDLSNPAAPVQVGSHAPGFYVTGLAVSGGRAYMTWAGEVVEAGEGHRKTGLRLLDVRDPADIKPLGQLELNRVSAVLALDEERGHVHVGTADGLEILDVRNPAQPVRVGRCEIRGRITSGWLADLVTLGAGATLPDGTTVTEPVVDRYVLVGVAGHGDGPSDPGVHLVKVSDLSRPARIGWHPTDGGVLKMAYAEGRLHVLTTPQAQDEPFLDLAAGSGLLVLDVRDPANPVRLGGKLPDQPHLPYDFTLAGGHVLLAEGDRGLRTLRLGEAPRLLGIRAVDDAVVLRFVAGGTDATRFSLESTDSLDPPVVWTPVPVAGFAADQPDGVFEAVTARQGDQRSYRVNERPLSRSGTGGPAARGAGKRRGAPARPGPAGPEKVDAGGRSLAHCRASRERQPA